MTFHYHWWQVVCAGLAACLGGCGAPPSHHPVRPPHANVQPTPEFDPSDLLQSARANVCLRNYAKAFEEYRWCFERGPEARISFIGAWAAYVVPELAVLGKKHPEAARYVAKLEQQLETAIREDRTPRSPDYPLEVWAIVSLQVALGHEDRTLELLRSARPKHRVYLWATILPRLVERMAYSIIAQHGTECSALIAQRATLLRRLRTMRRVTPAARSSQRRYLRFAAGCFEGLVGGGNVDQARDLARGALEELPGRKTIDALRQAAARADRKEGQTILDQLLQDLHAAGSDPDEGAP